MRTAFLLGFSLLLLPSVKAQEMIPLKGDLKGAPLIGINQTYSFARSPGGYGSQKEFKENPQRSGYLFREERNSAWFLIQVPFNGLLTFDLKPHQIKDDYDWMLFKYSPELDKLIAGDYASPLRTNNARNAITVNSKTGMNSEGKSNFAKPGPGNNYSLPLRVKAGEKFALILDNIYGGKGFDLKVSVGPDIQETYVYLAGTVKDRQSNAFLSAEIMVDDDSTGVLIGKSVSDSLTGRYKVRVPVNRPLNITAWHPGYLFTTADTFVTDDSELDFLLNIPAIGNKLVLNNIHFYPNKDEILPSSMPELNRLLLLMKDRPDLTVKITGHTNQNVFASARYLQQLSFNRAVAVKKFLTKNSVAEKRISCTGVGGKVPLVVTKDPEEGLRNLRVEVTLVKK
ncbi:OmpA family protein [Flavihumibacter sp. R14]|nr:OmpA family protein [Flavihumibacter soli]